MTDTIYYYCRFCAERLAARLIMDFDSHPTVREDVQKKISIFQHSFIDLDLKILPQSICKSCYETLNRAFLFVSNVRKSQIVLIELYLDIVGSDDDDEESLSKTRRSVEGPLFVNGEATSVYEEQNTSDSVDKEAFSTDENKSVGAEAIKESSENEATSLGRHKTGKEPNVDRELVNLDSTAAENDTSISVFEFKKETSDNEEDTDRTLSTDSIEERTVVNCCELSKNQESLECKKETIENDQETDRIVNIDSIEDSGYILKETASSQNQESLDCKEEISDNDYEDTKLIDPLDVTTDDDPIMRETLSLQGQYTYESQVEVTSSGHDTVCKEPNEDSELLNLNTTSTRTNTMTPQNHELITIVEYKEETDNEEDSDKINNKYSTEDRGATAKETPSSESQESKSSKEVTKASDNDTDRIVGTNSTVGRASVVKETVATQSQESLECKEQKKRKRKKENNDKNYDEKQQKKKRKRENNDNDYEDRKRKDQIDSTLDSHPILKETVPLHSEESSECQEALTPDKDPRVDKVSVSTVTWDTNLYDCKLCDSRFSDINSLREHCKSLHQVCNGFRCRECSMELADFDTFVSHHREHRPELEDFCQFCNMELKSAGAGHVASHGDLFCKFCGEVFISVSGFKEHYLLYAPEAVNNGRSHCVHCGHELGNDETPHRDSLSDACVACGEHLSDQTLHKRDSSQQNYQIFSTNASIKEKSCKNYNKKESSYFNKILNNGHSKLIWNYFECDHCHKKIKFKSELQRHMASHYDVYPFYCKLGDAKFKLHYRWKRHLKSDKHAMVSGDTSSVTLGKCFECDHCHKQFKEKIYLRQHMISHYEVYPFYCKFCDAKFKCSSHWIRHLKTGKHTRAAGDTIGKYVECDHCHKQFKFKSCLQNHMVVHYDVYPFYCKLCDAKFKLHYRWKQHLKSDKHAMVSGDTSSVTLGKYFECDHCHKQFKEKIYLRQHMISHYEVYPFYCKFCDAKFKCSSHWIRHLKTGKHTRAAGDTIGKYVECDHCHKQFKFKSCLQNHMVVHYDVYPFYCKLCDAKFKLHYRWKQHLKSDKHARAAGDTSSVTLERYFECDHCHKQFNAKYTLQQHMTSHYNVYPFYCKLCDAKFKLRCRWKRHLKSDKHAMVSGDTSSVTLGKYFECDHCHKQFKEKYHLGHHMISHYEVYPFYCKFCDAKFKFSCSWRNHLKSDKHTRAAAGERETRWKYFKCDHCHKQFNAKSTLRQHMTSHYPFYCKFCDAKFKSSSNWNQHLKSDKHTRAAAGDTSSVTLEKYFECDHCHKQFKEKSNLRSHLISHYEVYPFYCQFCDAKFKRHSHWKKHLKSGKHTRAAAGDTSSVTLGKYFECDHCHKKIKFKSELQRHMTIHYEVYPFYCKFCDARFKLHRHWKQHLKSGKHARTARAALSKTIQMET